MRRLLFLMSLVIAGGWYLKSNLNSMDGHVQSAGWSLPTLGVGQLSEVVGTVSLILRSPGPAASPISSPQDSSPGSHNSPAGVASSSGGAGLAKDGNFTIAPELLRFVNPSLLTTSPSGTQNLSPEARIALRQIIAQARANPAAFKEQLNTARGQQ